MIMIYPILYIDQNNNQNLINIFDTEFDNENPVLSMEGDKEVFFTLFKLFLNQYSIGFNNGYEVGFDDAEYGDTIYGEYEN